MCGHLLASECFGKRRFTQQAAGLTSRRFPAQCAYPCHTCGEWHVGKKLPNEAARDRDRDTIVLALRRSGNGWLLTQLAEVFRPRNGTRDRARWKDQREAGR